MLTDHTFAPFLPSLSLPLSDSYSSTVTIRISLPLPLQKDIPPRFPPPAPPVFSANSNFNVHPRQISEPIQLEAYRPYYVEVYHKEGTEADYVNVNVRIVCVCVRACVRPCVWVLLHSLSTVRSLPPPRPPSQWQVPDATDMSGIPRNQFAMAKYCELHS